MKSANLTDTQKIFMLAKINGQDNHQELLPNNGWTWPQKSWLSERLEKIRKERGDESQY